MSTLTRYVSRMLLTRWLVILLTVAGFAVLFDLLDVGTRVLRRTDGSAVSLARYVVVRLPSLITDLLPITALLASLVAVYNLTRHRELMAVGALGVSRPQLMLRLLPLALLLCAGKLLLDDRAVPATLPALKALGVVELGRVVGATDRHVWLRSGQDVIRIDAVIVGQELTNVLIIARDAQGLQQEQIRAARAVPGAGAWRLEGVVRQPAAARPPERLDRLDWPVAIDVERVVTMAKLPRELGTLDLWRIVRADGWGIAPVQGQATWLHGRLAGAAMMLLFTLAGPALARGFTRQAPALPLFGRGLGLGFGAMVGQGILLAVGEVGLVPPILAAWAVPAIIAAVLLAGAGPYFWAAPQMLPPPEPSPA